MSRDWRPLVDGADGLRIIDDRVEVSLPNGRRHTVTVTVVDDGWLFEAVGARRSCSPDEPWSDPVWTTNATRQLVGVRLDERGRCVTHAWCPAAGVTTEVFRMTVVALAREADSIEMRRTGKDRW